MAANTLDMIVNSVDLSLHVWTLVQKLKTKKYHAFSRNNKTLEDIEKHVEGIKDSEIQ
jgi:hypothetical protein